MKTLTKETCLNCGEDLDENRILFCHLECAEEHAYYTEEAEATGN